MMPWRTVDSDFRQRLGQLKARIADLQDQIEDVHTRLNRIADRRVLERRAAVDSSRCTGCRICESVCPQNAVQVTNVARVDRAHCTGCGTCVIYCPQGAIRLVPDARPVWTLEAEGM
jgi:Fe-S-cluster-containing hydrogenase component 2